MQVLFWKSLFDFKQSLVQLFPAVFFSKLFAALIGNDSEEKVLEDASKGEFYHQETALKKVHTDLKSISYIAPRPCDNVTGRLSATTLRSALVSLKRSFGQTAEWDNKRKDLLNVLFQRISMHRFESDYDGAKFVDVKRLSLKIQSANSAEAAFCLSESSSLSAEVESLLRTERVKIGAYQEDASVLFEENDGLLFFSFDKERWVYARVLADQIENIEGVEDLQGNRFFLDKKICIIFAESYIPEWIHDYCNPKKRKRIIKQVKNSLESGQLETLVNAMPASESRKKKLRNNIRRKYEGSAPETDELKDVAMDYWPLTLIVVFESVDGEEITHLTQTNSICIPTQKAPGSEFVLAKSFWDISVKCEGYNEWRKHVLEAGKRSNIKLELKTEDSGSCTISNLTSSMILPIKQHQMREFQTCIVRFAVREKVTFDSRPKPKPRIEPKEPQEKHAIEKKEAVEGMEPEMTEIKSSIQIENPKAMSEEEFISLSVAERQIWLFKNSLQRGASGSDDSKFQVQVSKQPTISEHYSYLVSPSWIERCDVADIDTFTNSEGRIYLVNSHISQFNKQKNVALLTVMMLLTVAMRFKEGNISSAKGLLDGIDKHGWKKLRSNSNAAVWKRAATYTTLDKLNSAFIFKFPDVSFPNRAKLIDTVKAIVEEYEATLKSE